MVVLKKVYNLLTKTDHHFCRLELPKWFLIFQGNSSWFNDICKIDRCLRAENISLEMPLIRFGDIIFQKGLSSKIRFVNDFFQFFVSKFRFTEIWSIVFYITLKYCCWSRNFKFSRASFWVKYQFDPIFSIVIPFGKHFVVRFAFLFISSMPPQVFLITYLCSSIRFELYDFFDFLFRVSNNVWMCQSVSFLWILLFRGFYSP